MTAIITDRIPQTAEITALDQMMEGTISPTTTILETMEIGPILMTDEITAIETTVEEGIILPTEETLVETDLKKLEELWIRKKGCKLDTLK